MIDKQAVLKLNKKPGETPLECLNRFKADNPEYAGEKMTYAGRLDPLASGVLLVLVGEECKKKDKYLGLDKEYMIEVLFGFKTDTGDILGLVTGEKNKELKLEEIKESLKTFVEIKTRAYPEYSSPALAKAKVQEKTGEVKSIKYQSAKYSSSKALLKDIQKRIAKVNGEFRQKKILDIWEKALISKEEKYLTIKIKVLCSSGVYMRQLAEEIGEKFGVSSLAFSIKRVKIIGF